MRHLSREMSSEVGLYKTMLALLFRLSGLTCSMKTVGSPGLSPLQAVRKSRDARMMGVNFGTINL